VQGNCAIELKLDQCLSFLIAQARRGTSGNLSAGHLAMLTTCTRARIPSWLHLPALPAFTESVAMGSMLAAEAQAPEAPAPPLSSYTHDDALREAALRDSHAARFLVASHADGPPPQPSEPPPAAAARAEHRPSAGAGDTHAQSPRLRRRVQSEECLHKGDATALGLRDGARAPKPPKPTRPGWGGRGSSGDAALSDATATVRTHPLGEMEGM
jgi:hypothetical protein